MITIDFGMADAVANALYYILGMKLYREVMEEADLDDNDDPDDKDNQEAFLSAIETVRQNYRENQTAVDVLD